ncbi:endolytic transglycosylase MltG [Streptomyces sp. HNM0575]|uniref:endolytic transglycosylase MltG n=1 Tax=Streptomyces sp. HNM0575 TaxID=2716338 RepID=UPI00145D4D6E|nr:endolytic transglycosylase MltG [Streptomyces sp. HNM0575]NLU73706.1 endolytic transglycosylase MltG [Streptomyces sp. HNM0575]
MTDYGRGQSLPSWHPDDPLFGDQGWDGGRDAYPGDDGSQGGQYADPYSTGQHQVPQQQGYYEQQHQQHQQQYGQGGYQNPGAGGPYDPGHGMGATDPRGMPVVTDPYNTGQQPGYYAAQQGYPQHPQQGQGYPGPYAQPGPDGYLAPHPGGPGGGPGRPDADPETGWDPGPDQGEHAFFADRDGDDDDGYDDYDDYDDGGGRSKRSGRRNEGKRRSGCACLAVSVLLAGGLGTAGYYGYGFYQAYFAPAPDFSGKGSGQVQVKIPDGASIADMGGQLQKAGVVKSAGAFVEASQKEKKSSGIQPGTYSLRKKMSGAAAVKLMLDPASQNGLIISEGLRAKAIYQQIDKKLARPEGSTEKVAKKAGPELGLPGFAKGNPEGFLFPSRYSVGEGSAPEDVLRDMVGRAKAEHTKVDLAGQAKKAGKSPEEILTIASLIQAEAQQDEEFGKVSRVIYNRLDKGMRLGFDSTINYAKGRSSLDTSVEDTKFKSPYNTYLNAGLPPGPIDNPGHQAIEAALKPTKGNWLYFVTVKPGDTRFTASKAEHDRNVRDFNREQRKNKGNGG